MREEEREERIRELEREKAALEGKFCECEIPYPGQFFCRSCNRYFRGAWTGWKR